MTQKKKVEYQSPRTFAVETKLCDMLCASIVISNEETNSAGRVNRRRNDNVWENGLWDQNRW